jgi:hypothetical protein
MQHAAESRGVAFAQFTCFGTNVSLHNRRIDIFGSDAVGIEPAAEMRQQPKLQLVRLDCVSIVEQVLGVHHHLRTQRSANEDIERP